MIGEFIYSCDGHIYKILKKNDDYLLLERVTKNLGYIISYKYNKKNYDWESFIEYESLIVALNEFEKLNK